MLKKRKREDKKIIENDTGSFNDFLKITKGEFYCPNCAKSPNEIPEIAEILKIHSDSGKIDLRCQKCDKVFQYTIKTLSDKLKDNNFNVCAKGENCPFSDDNQKNNIQYCTLHKQIFCQRCLDSVAQKKIGFCLCSNEKDCIHIHIKQEEFGTMCQKHGLKTDECCRECEKNVCKKCFDEYHKRHNNKNIDGKEIENAKKKIVEKYKSLKKMKEFYELVQSSYEKNTKNNIYKKNVVNVAKCIKNEENRDNYDIDLALYKLRKKKKGVEIHY